MNSSHPNDKNNLFVGAGYTIKINRKDGEAINATAKRIYGQKSIITTSGLDSSTNVTVNTPTTGNFITQNTQTPQNWSKQPWCYTHKTNHPPCNNDKQMIEQDQGGIICPACNGTICTKGNKNMCH